MDLRATLDALASKAEPGAARCLRCTAMLRLFLAAMATLEPMAAEVCFDDEEIQAEVDALRRARPDLAGRFDAGGLPIGAGDCAS